MIPIAALVLAASFAQGDEPVAETTVGMRVRLDEFVIPGPQLVAKDVADPGRADVIVRVVNAFPHGTDWRYNLEITPFVEGEVDLREHLERVDGEPLEGVPEMWVLVDRWLEEADEEIVMPNELDVPAPDEVGGYKRTMIALGVAWVIGLFALMFVGRRRAEHAEAAARVKPKSLADRLRPLVERARKGEIEDAERAELERLLLAHWRRMRSLDDVPVAEAVSTLRADDEAGPLLRKLEEWLHRPGPAAEMSESEVAELLAPYQNIPATSTHSNGTVSAR